ncbi:MAG: hypothetical protein HN576_08680 [Bacteriovoracaceae bacterium]|nr:hypothetical protein [Bacteriovoracaceae bacterium]
MIDIQETQIKLKEHLAAHSLEFFPHHDFKAVYEHSLFPPGKLFRPLLAYSIFMDIQKDDNYNFHKKTDISYFCSALEVHHTYTLIHDDLPCMDNDDERRGRPSAHTKYNEWKALLAGDGLLNMSYGLISKINNKNDRLINRIFSWCLGPRGLIQGQMLDLSGEMTSSFENIVLTHKLKTSRLIQSAILCGSLCSDKINRSYLCDLARIGEDLGLLFQFFDDLSELVDEQLTKHEKEVNPWLYYSDNSLNRTIKSLERTLELINKYELYHIQLVICEYLTKMKNVFKINESIILKHIKKGQEAKNFSLAPLMSLF